MIRQLIVAAGVAGFLVGCDQVVNSAGVDDSISARGTVTALDPANRRFKVKSGGETITMRANEQVRNFDQIAVGDKVDVVYRESVFATMADPAAELGGEETSATVVAPEGDKPGLAVAEDSTRIVEFVAYDGRDKSATIREADGSLVRVAVPRQMRKFARSRVPGDKILVDVQQAAAVAVSAVE